MFSFEVKESLDAKALYSLALGEAVWIEVGDIMNLPFLRILIYGDT